MKNGFKVFLAFLAMLLLVVAALGLGAYRGFTQDKAQVEQALQSLSRLLETRVEMGNNLLTVARRHLDPKDELLVALEADVSALSQAISATKRAQANQLLTQDSQRVLEALRQQPSVKADERDSYYVNQLLPQGMEQSAQWADAQQYNQAVTEFNNRLTHQLNGKLAMLLGVQPAELFAAEGDAR